MNFYGGTYFAGLIHRGCAILTFYYFVAALILSIDFLFIRKDVRDVAASPVRARLTVPEPARYRDVVGMVRWFLFLVRNRPSSAGPIGRNSISSRSSGHVRHRGSV